jgi:putative ABC transport system ATP-binding protein
VSLSVRPGEFVAVIGPSGCGKSTLLHMLGGLEAPDRGQVLMRGVDLYSLGEAQRADFRRRQIGFVFQFFNLLPSLTAAENVMLPYRLERNRAWPLRGLGRDHDARAKAQDVMAMLGLKGLQGHRPDEISGGEQQRVALARALVSDPAVLLADEPTGTLDYHAGRGVLELLLRLSRQEGRTIVLVTHDVRTAAYAERVAIMLDGEFREVVELGRRTVHDTAPLLERLGVHGL